MPEEPRRWEAVMSIEFAEKILDGMVDENGHCGDRAMSRRQFEILEECSGVKCTEVNDHAGSWEGDYSFREFWERVYEGNIGKYAVRFREFHHFHGRYTIDSIDLRPRDEYEFELRMRELAKFEGSEWVGDEKQRMDMELTLVRVSGYKRPAYTYGTEWVSIYTLADADGNCIVWKTTSALGVWVPDEGMDSESWVDADPGDKVTMKATVKEHSEWKGIKQTVITRPKVKGVEKRAA